MSTISISIPILQRSGGRKIGTFGIYRGTVSVRKSDFAATPTFSQPVLRRTPGTTYRVKYIINSPFRGYNPPYLCTAAVLLHR